MIKMPFARRSTSIGAILLMVLVVVGIALRLRTLQLNNSLWLDESSLALNILSRSYADLLKPLDYSQGAPIFFLWFEKLSVVLSQSASEFALRTVPFLAGAAACVGFWMLCRSFKLTIAASLCSVTLFTFSPGLIDYSSQAKQYSTDVLVVIALYITSVRFLGQRSLGNTIVFGLVGVVAMGLSHPSVFVLAGVGLTGLIDGWRKRDWRGLAFQSALVCCWMTAFAFNYFFFLRSLSHIPGMADYWQRTYQAFMPLSFSTPSWLLHAGSGLANMGGFIRAILLAAVAGGILLWRMDWRIPTMLYLPVALAIFASAVQRYPFADRMTMFAVPALLISAGVGISDIPLLRGRFFKPVVVVGLLCILMFAPMKRAAALTIYPEHFRREEFRDTFLAAVRSGRCTDAVLVYERCANHYRYYNRYRWSSKYTGTIVTASQLGGESFERAHWIHFATSVDRDVSSFDSPQCFWLVFAHTSKNESSSLSNSLHARGYREMETIQNAGASAHLFAQQ